ncbi:hypothetical protein QOZ80_1AG0009540 [Eleusine coracana subsp. coracana]|uniref:Factor of DNA methylation 1-5/IDN2 domain-containing protein n=1 Tax=Eleusine coracana subsp. coracana TaxID=191504 RepID=A0AAV9G3G0_ELECO|nr:hypothetical protein QOZ80_UnG0726310 [Eleusine coracana subsp. coracana]KAK3163876.1 hypothetical protein QOZ80_1AG0009540 [Eleusine coracana subsp. coracana]
MSSDDVLMANAGELLLWPWTGILATTTADANAVTTLAAHAHQRFAGITTTALQEEAPNHRLNFLVIHFGKSWSGLRYAMSLAFHFTAAGRRDWQQQHGEGVFGWAAGEDDLLGDGTVARFLREAGVRARSVEDVEKEESSIATVLGAAVGEYERRAKELQAKHEEKVLLANKVEEESSWINGELKEFRKLSDNVIPEMNRGIHEENEKFKIELDAVSREIESRVERIQELKDGRTQLHRSKVQKLAFEINSLDMAGREPKTNQEHERLKKSYFDLKKREWLNKDVFQEHRKELVKGFEGMMSDGHNVIGIKRMGQLDEKPFHHACKRKFRDDDPVGNAKRLVSSWQEELKKTSWHPFITILVDGEDKDVVDEDDPKLRQLQAEYGDNVCNAVKVALVELNEHSPRGRDVVNELWNFREARKATMSEVVKYIFEQLKASS